MWFHSHLIWSRAARYSQRMWSRNERSFRFEPVYVLSSYEADVVKPLMHFFCVVAVMGWPTCRSKSKAKNPKGFGEQSSPIRLAKKTNNNTLLKIDAKLDASIFSRTVLKERFPPEA